MNEIYLVTIHDRHFDDHNVAFKIKNEAEKYAKKKVDSLTQRKGIPYEQEYLWSWIDGDYSVEINIIEYHD